jgi:hypothetical protein
MVMWFELGPWPRDRWVGERGVGLRPGGSWVCEWNGVEPVALLRGL